MEPPDIRDIFRRNAKAAQRDAVDGVRRCLATALDRITRDGTTPEPYVEAAAAYCQLDQFHDAVEILALGLRRCPANADLYAERIRALRDSNRTAEAIALAREACEHDPASLFFKFQERLLLPILYASPEDVDRHRARFAEGLAALDREIAVDSEPERLAALEAVAAYVPFFLAYQGRDDLDLQRQYGRFASRVMAASFPEYTRPRTMPPMPPDGRLRIGYVSPYFRTHSVNSTRSGWVRGHDPARIRVHAYSLGAGRDAATETVERGVARFYQHDGDFATLCNAIVADQLHALVYLNMGMDPLTTQLGALRLAPIQCTTWSHPVTSGLESMDFFLTSELMEPPDGDRHYSETLVPLPGIGICYERPPVPAALFHHTRRDFGIRDEAVVYMSGQSAFKYLPEHDHVFAEIAALVPQAQFVFIMPNAEVKRDFVHRLDRAFAREGLPPTGRFVILPKLDWFSYCELATLSDVCLDTIGWSGCNTTMEAIACKVPVVTVPWRFIRGRHAYAILTQLGVTDTIASDKEGYVRIAANLGLNPQWRRDVVERMVNGYPRLYGDRRSITALEEFFARVVRARLTS